MLKLEFIDAHNFITENVIEGDKFPFRVVYMQQELTKFHVSILKLRTVKVASPLHST